METTTDFAKYLTRFFSEYLVGERGASSHTIRSYSETFTLVLTYMDKVRAKAADRLTLNHFNRETVLGFLDWLEKIRKCSHSTRNQRLAALHSFFRYMQYEDVKRLEQWQDILSIKVKKQGKRSAVNCLSVEGIKFLLEQIPINTKAGRRNLTLLALLYDSGARVHELIDLTPTSLHLIKPYYVTLLGKGSKKRIVPMQNEQVNLLIAYIKENRLDNLAYNQRPLFANNRGERLTNSGVTYILNIYVQNARVLRPDLIPEKMSPHTLRHSKAMHLLQSGINLVYIRDILGHVSIQTTEVYARADSKQKREALEAAYVNIIPDQVNEAIWEKDSKLREWLRNFNK
ncbi:tyrosine-type recombinase/integrase [Changchengzhania lutea]|uniref:tyrosine-type recombinase/integrase n=1 Tax=Changchengzhania lutea TaxID=2049305 RepID=UPI00115F1225|nr:tyrosine-type recombinase/integrase [Changchengzhania lutea]